MKGFWSIILICLSIFTACSQEEEALKIDLSKREKVILKEDENIITYAYLPQYAHTVSYQRHHLLVEYLRKETGLNVKQIFPDTFNKHIKMVGQGRIDISYSNPFIYTKIANRYGARAFSRVVEMNNRKNFRGQIICRADNRSIKSIADCRGKRWIAVDRSSAGGYLYPLGHFIEHGLTKSDFSEIAFSPGPGGKQEKVVLAVYAGKYDIGTIREGTLNVVSDKIDISEIRVVANSRWYPGWVYAARKELAPEIVEKIKKALLKLDYNNIDYKPILRAAQIMSIIASDDQDFDPVRKLAVNLGIGL
ncbi:MAG: phosphate/phosphite/phosphonate ABC transporter substrate-binding protein [Deltaproteobacteria bacterium]|nr:phosphate/phosphite/phosphonate ABC transporter substrate-binding protein [Deltaproteobacteria bacterium]MBT8356600.1 phosphate/phosphite/phosphonate ABC transporter substrate-binding protein [Deltaproteobacteria bacterium]